MPDLGWMIFFVACYIGIVLWHYRWWRKQVDRPREARRKQRA